jgi:hypothetical protein
MTTSKVAAVLFFVAALMAFIGVTVSAARSGGFNYPLLIAGLFLAGFGVIVRRHAR